MVRKTGKDCKQSQQMMYKRCMFVNTSYLSAWKKALSACLEEE